MHRIVSSVTTLAQHFHTVAAAPQAYRLPACPHCGLGRPWHHGCYQRKVGRGATPAGARLLAPVCRFFCRSCRRTHSRLPLCIAPRRWFDWVVQQLVLLSLLTGASLRASAQQAGVDRHTARRWRHWVDAPRSRRFAFHLRSQWPQLGATADGPPFWREVFAHVGLPQAMACLDRLLAVP